MAGAWIRWRTVLGGVVVGVALIAVCLAAEGDLQLVGSDRGIEGKLFIEHDGVLRTVCTDGWTYMDADTACRQLGYSKGAMIFRASNGEFMGPPATPTLQAPGCTDSDDRLTDCPNFQYQENLSCTSEVDLSCYVDDFVGCYLNTPPSWNQNELLPGPTNSIERCLDFCRTAPSNPRFAALAGNRCFCGSDMGSLGVLLLPPVTCALMCSGDAMEACGISNADGVTGFFAIWPVSVGTSGGTFSTASGCLYSRGFPGPYPTTDRTPPDEYTVTLPASKYVSLDLKVFDIFDSDRVRITDETVGSARTTVNLEAPSSPGEAVIPFEFPIAMFSVSFTIDAASPTETNYGFVICYESLDQLPTPPPTPPTTNPPTEPPTDPTTAPSTAPPTDPQTNPSAQPSTEAPTTAPADSSTTLSDPSVVPSTAQATDPPATPTLGDTTVASTAAPTVDTTTKPPVTTENIQLPDLCPAYHGDPVEYRPGQESSDALLLNTGNPFNCSGFVTDLSYYSAGNQTFEVSVWHAVHDLDTDRYRYTAFALIRVEGAAPGLANVSLDRDAWLPFGPGDVLGVRFQTSPVVSDDVDGETAEWMRWELDDGSLPGNVSEIRDTTNATALNRTFSISATLTDKSRCLVPDVPNAEFTDVVISYVYEGDIYMLRCERGYRAVESGLYLCQASGGFDTEPACEETRIFGGLTFTELIICVVVLALLFLTVCVVACALLCCRSGDTAQKAPEPGPGPEHGFEPAASLKDASMRDANSLDDNHFLIDINSENGEPVGTANPTLDETDAHGVENGIANPEAGTEGTPVIDNPIADVSSQPGYIYGPPSEGMPYHRPPSPPPPPPVPPPPPPVPTGTNPPKAPAPSPLYLQPTSAEQSPPDSPNAGSDAALIAEDQSDTLSDLSRGGRVSRRIGTGISSRLSVFQK